MTICLAFLLAGGPVLAGAHGGVERFSLRFCNANCASDDDCRTEDGYVCFDADGDGVDECAAEATGNGAVGDTCTTHLDCAGGQRASPTHVASCWKAKQPNVGRCKNPS